MRRITTLLIAAMVGPAAFAQQSIDVQPVSKSIAGLENNVPVLTTTSTDHAVLLAEDEANAGEVAPFRFGTDKLVDLEFTNSGVWETLATGDRIWRLDVESEGAFSLNFTFDGFHLPEGATFHIHNEFGVLGAFTSSNNSETGEFATDLLKGDHATLEYYEPSTASGQGTLGLKKIVHAYRDIVTLGQPTAMGGPSGPCNINVACPAGIGWENEIAGSVRIVMDGFLCSGAMINDVPESGTPYLLTADHCLDGSGSPSIYVFNFNYEAATCNGTTASTGQSISGATLRARDASSDFALLELNSTPPLSYETFYLGWTRSTIPANNTTCIHHPSGDIKKISKDYNSPQSTSAQGVAIWRVNNWEEGVTEGGSSGSPLLDQNHRIVGQLFAGTSSCSNPNGLDIYGRFDASWNGPNSASRLKDWLDPNNTDTTFVDGWDPNESAFELDAGIPSLETIEDGGEVCGDSATVEILLANGGNQTLTSATINWEIDNVAQPVYNWTGSLEFPDDELVDLGTYALGVGPHTMEFIISSPNGGVDEDPLNDTISVSFTMQTGNAVDLELRTDAQPTQTTWDLFDDQNNLILSSDPYTQQVTTHNQILCLSDGCYEFTIYDSGNNGICCNVGSGWYVLDDPNGEPMIGGGDFGSEETQGFCLPFVAPMPVADFSANNTAICTGDNVIYTNSSTPTVGTSREWIFEGGSPNSSTSNAPLITYNATGTYDVTLIITNSTGADTLVMQDHITVTEVSASSSNIVDENLWTGGDNGSATVTGADGTEPYTYSWSPGGGTGSTRNDLSAGNYIVTVIDAVGCETTVSVTIGNNVGVDETADDQFSIYPNPSNGHVFIELKNTLDVISVDVLDVTGSKIRTLNWDGMARMSLDISDLTSGSYFVSINTTEGRFAQRMTLMTE